MDKYQLLSLTIEYDHGRTGTELDSDRRRFADRIGEVMKKKGIGCGPVLYSGGEGSEGVWRVKFFCPISAPIGGNVVTDASQV